MTDLVPHPVFKDAAADIAALGVRVSVKPHPDARQNGVAACRSSDLWRLIPLENASVAANDVALFQLFLTNAWHIKLSDSVAYEATVDPAATDEVCVPMREKSSNLNFNRDFFYGYSPYHINRGRQGAPRHRHPDDLTRLPRDSRIWPLATNILPIPANLLVAFHSLSLAPSAPA